MHDTDAVLARDRWGLILAGGEGRRLRRLTERIAGAPIPKQFCAIVGGETLVERTRRRAALVIPPARTCVVLTRAHEPFYRSLVAAMPPHCAVVQPDDRGTAAAILYGLLRVAAFAPTAPVAIMPSDHWTSDDGRLMHHVATAFAAVDARPDLVVLLGAAATHAETQYGWIEPGERMAGVPLARVRAFHEKPSASAARSLYARGGLWNTFVMVGRIPAFLATIRRALPALDRAFAGVRAAVGTAAERDAIRTLYRDIDAANFSDAVLQTCAANLAVLPVSGVEWSDWGTPERVLATLSAHGIEPSWAPGPAVA